MSKTAGISPRQIERYPEYLRILHRKRSEGQTKVSSRELAKEMFSSEEQVRKDLQAIATAPGRPGFGRTIQQTIEDLEEFLGVNDVNDAILIGAGRLGSAILDYQGFQKLGLNILAGFDVDPDVVGKSIQGKAIFDMEKLENLIGRLNVNIAILTVPSDVAQPIAERLVEAGIKAIWNFAPTTLILPEDIIVESVDLARSLTYLSTKLKNKFKGE